MRGTYRPKRGAAHQLFGARQPARASAVRSRRPPAAACAPPDRSSTLEVEPRRGGEVTDDELAAAAVSHCLATSLTLLPRLAIDGETACKPPAGPSDRGPVVGGVRTPPSPAPAADGSASASAACTVGVRGSQSLAKGERGGGERGGGEACEGEAGAWSRARKGDRIGREAARDISRRAEE